MYDVTGFDSRFTLSQLGVYPYIEMAVIGKWENFNKCHLVHKLEFIIQCFYYWGHQYQL